MRALRFLPWLLLALPLLELLVFVRVAGAMGFFNTVLLTVAISFAGLSLIRSSGLGMTQIAPDKLFALLRGRGFRLLAGVLLFIPGFITDFFALFCLVPAVRGWLVERLSPAPAAAAQQSEPAAEQRHEAFTQGADTARTRTGGRTVDGEFERMD